MKRTTTSILVLTLLAAACGSDDASDTSVTSTSTSTTSVPDGPPKVLLSMTEEGGFMMLEFVLNRPPSYTLLTDDTLIFQGPQNSIFPGPVMPSMQQIKLTPDQLNDIEVLIEASGLPDIDDVVNNEANNFVADATSTVATYFDPDGGVHRISVYALGIIEDMPDDLANLNLLRDKLSSLTSSAPGDPYTTDELIVHTLEGGGVGSEFNDVRPWAFSFDPKGGGDPAAQFPCFVLAGADAEAARALLADATQATQWEHDSGTFGVLARDLMPGELGCDSQ